MDAITGNKMNSSSCSKLTKIQQSSFGTLPTLLIVFITILTVCCGLIGADRSIQNLNQAVIDKNLEPVVSSSSQHSSPNQQHNGALEAELNSIVQQHDALDMNNKQLADAIISRLMVDNLTGSNLMSGTSDIDSDISSSDITSTGDSFVQEQASDLNDQATSVANAPDAIRLRKLMNVLHNYQTSLAGSGGLNGGLAIVPYPILPSSQAATMKRAAMKMGNFLQQQQRQTNPYARNNFDFGLGKRPDSTILSGNILRYGDSALAGQIQPVSQFGKRPSSHRYDFGLGKRVASPAYPRYDFGLGKRAPSRIRYDFGLGK